MRACQNQKISRWQRLYSVTDQGQLHRLGEYEILGTTLDDAVGEAFDKTAKLLGLGYPGGPALAALAEEGDERAISFPRPMLKRPGFDFSFSGLKTAVMIEVRKATERGDYENQRANFAASFQRAAVDTLVAKSISAAAHENLERIVVAGGVGANRLLRAQMATQFQGQVYYPRPAYCTDNGAMIAVAGALRIADASALEIHEQIEEIHALSGRARSVNTLTSRSLDIDLLMYDDIVSAETGLRLPRQDILEYSFVLRPFAELAPDLVHPETGRSLAAHWRDFDATRHPLTTVRVIL